jgi:hypothetical protein
MNRSKGISILRSSLLFSLLIQWGAVVQGQVETIDPNPTMPRDIGGRLTYRGFSGGGIRLGRTTPRDENPAETLLKSIDGTNYGRATGHSIFSQQRIERPIDARRRSSSNSPQTATTYTSRRDFYEDRVYDRARSTSRTAGQQQRSALSAKVDRAVRNSASPMINRRVRVTADTQQHARNAGKDAQRKVGK